jgi:threonine dehydrogenase-like Zn-dependent dehydrogenase
MGLGPAGLIALQMARAEGAAHVIGYDFSQARRDVALRLGADMVYDPRGEEAASLPFRPGATVADCGIDCVGARVSVEYLMDRVETTLALFGVQREDYTYSLRHYRNLRLCGYPGHSRAAAEYAVALIERGDLDLTPLVTHWLPLERYGDGVDLLERQEAIKICFDPWRS